MAEPDLSQEMAGYQAQFQAGLKASDGFFYPYRYPAFACNIWPADMRGGKYAAAVAAVPDLAQRDVRLIVVRPGDIPPAVGERLEFDGGRLMVQWWGQIDALSGESIGACSWEAG